MTASSSPEPGSSALAPYEPTPVEPRPHPSAYDHLPPYTNLAPRRRATVWMPPPVPTDVADRPAKNAARGQWLGAAILVVTVILILQAVLRPLLTSPELLFPTRATAPTFSVSLLDGTSQPLQDPSMVLRVTWSSGETFSVWSSTSTAAPSCDAEVAQRIAGHDGPRTKVTVYLDGTLATGTRVNNAPLDDTIVCAQRNGVRYVVDDFAVISTSSFDTVASSWRWS